jgi:tRNA(Ile)-lysidine synthase
MQHAASTSLLFNILSEFKFNETAILSIIENNENNSGIVFENETHEALIDRKFIIVRERKVEVINQTLHIDKKTLSVETPIGKIGFETLSEIPTIFSKKCLYLNKEKTGDNYILQTWQHGYRFKPLGMNGNKLVSDYLIDKKINLFEKQKCMVLVSKKNHEIAAVIPYQISNDYKLENDSKSILKICW